MDKSPKTITLTDDWCEVIEVDRHEVLSAWAVHVVEEQEVYKFGDYPSPLLCKDMLAEVWKGHIKSTLMEAFKKSSEPHTIVYKQHALTCVVEPCGYDEQDHHQQQGQH